MFDRIPDELKRLIQWTVWRYEGIPGAKPTKVPINPKTGYGAASDNRSSWVSFDEAVSFYLAHTDTYSGIGFFFSEHDPYCGVDLDDVHGDAEAGARQTLVFERLNSYAERSPSGTGLHIIVKAKVPNGRKRSFIEIYSSGRYFTFTGNVYNDVPIVDRQDEITAIWTELGPQAVEQTFFGDFIERADDETILRNASEAANGDLFRQLWSGDWSGYPSNLAGDGSSEADLALVNIIAYYTKNRIQIQRLFEASGLGRRAKYQNASAARRATLIGYMITKSFDLTLPDIDFSAIIDQMNAARASPSLSHAPAAFEAVHSPTSDSAKAGGVADAPPAPLPQTLDGYDLTLWRSRPPSDQNTLIGGIAHYIYHSSKRPVYEISLTAAIALMAGICGRGYNVSETGLNLYVMLLAETGTGKDEMDRGISAIIEAIVSKHDMASARHIIGPAEIASGQALLRNLSERAPPSMLAISGEIGLTLQRISHPNALSSDITLRKVILDLFMRSGANRTVQPSIYSDKKNNTEAIKSPAFSWLGESVAGEFFKAFDESSIASGLLPRFMIIEYTGPRVEFNRAASFVQPPALLVDELKRLITSIAFQSGLPDPVKVVPFANREAEEYAFKIDAYCTLKINARDNALSAHLWNRAHLKVLKLAALVAVSNNQDTPMITRYDLEWSASLIFSDIVSVLARFARGDYGRGNETSEQEERIRTALKVYLTCHASEWKKKKINPTMRENGVVSYSYLQSSCIAYKAFQQAKNGATASFKTTLQQLVDKGILRPLVSAQEKEQFKLGSAVAYAIIDPHWIMQSAED